MIQIQEAVRAHLQEQTGVETVCDRSLCRRYPMLAVSVREEGVTLLDGGRQAEHAFSVTVYAATDRSRAEAGEMLSQIVPVLLRGIPMEQTRGDAAGAGAETAGESAGERSASGESKGYRACEKRVLHPLNLSTEGEELTFTVALCVPLPPAAVSGQEEAGVMTTLHFHV